MTVPYSCHRRALSGGSLDVYDIPPRMVLPSETLAAVDHRAGNRGRSPSHRVALRVASAARVARVPGDQRPRRDRQRRPRALPCRHRARGRHRPSGGLEARDRHRRSAADRLEALRRRGALAAAAAQDDPAARADPRLAPCGRRPAAGRRLQHPRSHPRDAGRARAPAGSGTGATRNTVTQRQEVRLELWRRPRRAERRRPPLPRPHAQRRRAGRAVPRQLRGRGHRAQPRRVRRAGPRAPAGPRRRGTLRARRAPHAARRRRLRARVAPEGPPAAAEAHAGLRAEGRLERPGGRVRGRARLHPRDRRAERGARAGDGRRPHRPRAGVHRAGARVEAARRAGRSHRSRQPPRHRAPRRPERHVSGRARGAGSCSRSSAKR